MESESSEAFKPIRYNLGHSRNYSGPEIEPNEVPTTLMNAEWVYFGIDGSIYDYKYRTIQPKPNFSKIESIVFPEVEKYNSLVEYEQAVLQWKDELKAAIGNIKLPHIVGRYYFRPKVTSLLIQELSAYSLNTGNESFELNDSPDTLHFAKLSESSPISSRRGSDVDLHEIIWKRIKDPWESILIPEEPSPHNFNSEQEYQEAMNNWVGICVKYTPLIPPHPYQLSTLIEHLHIAGDILGNVNISVSIHSKDSTSSVFKVKSGITIVDTLEGELFENIGLKGSKPPDNSYIRPIIPFNKKPQGIWKQLDKTTKENINKKFIQAILSRRLSFLETYKVFNKPTLPQLHGFIPQNIPNSNNSSANNFGFLTALRRTDLLDSVLSSTLDCAPVVGGVRVQVDMRDPNLAGLNYSKMFTPSYQLEIRNRLQQQIFENRANKINSWFHPNDQHNLKKYELEFRSIMEKNSDNFTLETLQEILWNPMYFDQFQAILAQDFPKINQPFRTLILSFINPQNFSSLLQLFKFTSSYLIQAKLSVVIGEVLQTGIAKDCINALIQNLDFANLYRFAYSITVLHDEYIDIFPFLISTYELCSKFIGNSMKPVLDSFLVYYYIEIINTVVLNNKFLYIAFHNYISLQLKELSNKLGQLLFKKENFLEIIFKGISNRSSSISSFFLFMCTRMVHHTSHSGIKHVIISEKFLDLLRKISDSKFTHTQFAVRHLFNMISENEIWFQMLCTRYSKSILLQDLTANSILLATLVEQFCSTLLTKITKENVREFSFILNGPLFRNLLEIVLKFQRNRNLRIKSVSAVLAILAKTFFRIGTVDLEDQVPVKPKKRRGTLTSENSIVLLIKKKDLIDILYFINNGENDEQSFAIRSNMIACLRHLLKSPVLFNCLKKDTQFYAKLLQFCREGRHHSFNKNAWKLFFQTIEYHSGAIEEYIKNKYLVQFLDLAVNVSNNSGIVITNGLHYLKKLFQLCEKANKGGTPFRNDPKSVEKDVKMLVSFFIEKHHFIKLHIMYKRFTQTYPGGPFRELASFYKTIVNDPSCEKLLKDAFKNNEYKEGLLFINNLFIIKDESVQK